MKKFIAIIITASVLAISASAVTPLLKPVKLPAIPTITLPHYTIKLPHYDLSYAVEQYLKEHPVT